MTPAASELRLAAVPWRALAGLGPALAPPLAAVLAGEEAERAVDRFLRAHRRLDGVGRAAVKEAIYGVAVWRRRLAYHIASTSTSTWTATPTPTPTPTSTSTSTSTQPPFPPPPPPLLLLGALVRDLGAVADAEQLLDLPPGSLPPRRPAPADLATRFSFPDWLAETLVREAGDEAAALADALDQPGPLCLRPNLLRTTPGALAARLASEGVATRAGALDPSCLVVTCLVVTSPRVNIYGLGAWREGLFEVQDEASQLAGALAGARPGESALDLCAGAGGKTLQLAAAVGPSGAVHAADVDAERLDRLRRRAGRAGAAQIVRVHGAAPPSDLLVDCALVDAPCSELGALRRGPDRRFRLDQAALEALPPLQLGLLARAARHVRPGGRLAYAACTFRREEDEEVAHAFEATHPGFDRCSPEAPPGTVTPARFVRTWPHRRGASDAFFVAVWRRRG